MNNDEQSTKAFGIAKLNWAGPDFWCVYADGYKRACELLIEAEKNIYETNTIIFPILALYRQYVELSLKEIIAYGQYLDAEGAMRTDHDLKKLWERSKNYILKFYQIFEQDKLIRIQEIVYEIHEFDPTAQGARYPFIKPKDKRERTSEASLAHLPPFLSLDTLHDQIHELGELLSEVTHYLALSQDLEAELRSINRSY